MVNTPLCTTNYSLDSMIHSFCLARLRVICCSELRAATTASKKSLTNWTPLSETRCVEAPCLVNTSETNFHPNGEIVNKD